MYAKKLHYFRATATLTILILCLETVSSNVCAAESAGEKSELLIAAGSISITPAKPVALEGQFETRIARSVDNPCMATALALESRRDGKTSEQSLMISCDLCAIRAGILEGFREKLAPLLPDLDMRKVFLSATHTHTGPVTYPGLHIIPPDAIQTDEYREFLIERLCELAVNTWKSLRPGGVSWGLGHAVVAHNRRMVYADGSAVMYGQTGGDNFRRIEGREDHGVEVLFFWDENKKLIAAAVNIACSSQEVEHLYSVNADYWHAVREGLRKKYGDNLCVLGWCGAAGDQSPHILWRKQAEERMREKRGITRLEEIARRIIRAVDDAYQAAESDVHYDLPFIHVVDNIKLPLRLVTEKEYATAKTEIETVKQKNKPEQGDHRILFTNQIIVDRYEAQKTNPFYDMELHVIRLGDVAVATNPFELFTDYGIQIKARGKSLQTFVIQLAGPGTYLPTEEAIRGGSYSTAVGSCLVGPEGGQVLVDRTVEEINKLWNENQNDKN